MFTIFTFQINGTAKQETVFTHTEKALKRAFNRIKEIADNGIFDHKHQ